MASTSTALPAAEPVPLLTIRTLPPLPSFSTPHAVPPAETPVSRLKLSVVRMLTGSTISAGGAASASAAAAAANGSAAPQPTIAAVQELTYAEQVKETTLHGWRLQMLGLELRQNALIAPETRARFEQAAGRNGTAAYQDEEERRQDAEIQGFELKDDHECALLEEGDEIM